MSVEPVETVTEEAMLNFLINGEDTAEPEISEQPVAEAKVEETQPEGDEQKPPVEAPVIPEATEEPPLPDWAQGLDAKNEKIVDAINYYDKGEVVEWMGKGTDKMEADELEAFKEVQRSRQKHRTAQKTQVDPEIERQERLKKEGWDWIDRTLHPEKSTVKTEPQDQEPDLEARIAELVEEGDTAAVLKLMQANLDKKLEKGLAQKLSEMKNELKTEMSSEKKVATQTAYIQGVDAYGFELAEKDPMFDKMLETGADGLSALQRLYSMGVDSNGNPIRKVTDPRTGEVIIGWNDPKEDLDRARAYYLNGFKQTASNRPAPSAQPPSGSSEGNIPLLTEDDLNEDFDTYMRKGFKRLGVKV